MVQGHDSCARAPTSNIRTFNRVAEADARSAAHASQRSVSASQRSVPPPQSPGWRDDLEKGGGKADGSDDEAASDLEVGERPSAFWRAWAGHRDLLDFFVLRALRCAFV